MVVLIIFPVILQTVINLLKLSIGGQGQTYRFRTYRPGEKHAKVHPNAKAGNAQLQNRATMHA